MNYTTLKYCLVLLLSLLFASCVNPYDFMQNDSASTLVVEGFVSNNAGDSEIKLSRSRDFQRNVIDWISNAEVVVVENETVKHNFAYQKDGLYKPVQEDFSSKMESSYHLKIVLEGQEYESDLVSLPRSLDIDSISFKPAEDLLEDPSLEFFITSGSDEYASRYYMYSFDETWEVVATQSRDKIIKPIFTYDENHIPINIDFETIFEGSITHCWSSNKVEGLTTLSSEGLSRNQLVKLPVFRLSLQSPKLLYKYSVLVNQYAVSKEVHLFFNLLKDFSENSGFLYDTQPGYIEGNIHNKNTPEDKVIGIFYAASHNSARIFIPNDDLPSRVKAIVSRYHPPCNFTAHPGGNSGFPIDVIPNTKLTKGLQHMENILINEQGLNILEYYTFIEDGITYIEFQLVNLWCADCRVSGTNIKPIWWD